MLLVLALVAFVAGFIDAVAGGGGMLTVPALLSLGLPPHVALGTNKLAASFASSTAAFTYYKKRLFKPSMLGKSLCRYTCWGDIRHVICRCDQYRMA